MSKCVRCHDENDRTGRICSSCLTSWLDMRIMVFEALNEKLGKLTPDTHQQFIKEMKRMERTWRKDRDKFEIELNKIKN